MDTSRLTIPDWLATRSLAEMPDAVSAALVSGLVTILLLALFVPRRRAGEAAGVAEPRGEGISVFLINGSCVKALTASARAIVDGFGADRGRLAALGAHLAVECPDVQQDLENLVLYGTSFRHQVVRQDGSAIEIDGRPRGGAALLTIRPASEEARELHDKRAELARARAEVAFLRDVLDRAPVLVWNQSPDGQVSWANAAYRARFDDPDPELPDHRIPDGFAHVIEEVPLTPRDASTSRRRAAVAARRNGDPEWFAITESRGPGGDVVGFAEDAGELVAAESSLKRFVETLTETFAHLPIGLAIFDKNRRLGLFNPALCDLVRIDAVWLAGRPSLRDFLERLRETRQMPEQKDFASFRRKLTELEEGAREGSYEENWLLPSGKIFRVTGRPHPQGALAFLFEDISTTVQLERRYRSELELGQATLDRMSEAVAVFDTSGMLVFVNAAFETMWGADPMEGLEGPGVNEMIALWQRRCVPSPVWGELRAFATGAESRTSWEAVVETRAGRPVEMRVAPLPDASTLVVFREGSADRARLGDALERLSAAEAALRATTLVDELALGCLQVPAEAAIGQLASAIPAASGREAFATLSAAAQALTDGLARARELQALRPRIEHAAERPAAAGPLAGLAAMLEARGVSLEQRSLPAGFADEDAADLRRAVWSLALAAAEASGSGPLALTVKADGGGWRVSVEVPVPVAEAGGNAPEGVSLGVARRTLAGLGGSLKVAAADGRLTLLARVPPARRLALAPPPRQAAGGERR